MSRMLRQVRRAALVGAIGEKKLVVQKKKKRVQKYVYLMGRKF